MPEYDSIIAKRVAENLRNPLKYGVLAQLGEHLPYKQRVIGSSPIGPIYQLKYGGIAQLARAHGSYPWCRWFKSSFRYLLKPRFYEVFSYLYQNQKALSNRIVCK